MAKETKDLRKKAEETMREYKEWEKEQAQYLADFQAMEDYLEALSKSLKGNPEKAEDADQTAE